MKQPNWKTPLILSASLLMIGTFAYWLQYSHKPKKDKADVQTKKPIALPTEDTQVAMLKLKSSTGLIEIKCESLKEKKCSAGSLGVWKITHPTGPKGEIYNADPSVVKDVLNNAANAIATEVIDLSEDTPEKRKSLLSEYGLSDDKRANIETQFIELVAADAQGNPGKRYTAWFGTEHPIGDKTFVASSIDGITIDKTVFLISNHVKTTSFGKTVTNFREKTLFNFDRKNITEFTTNTKLNAKKVNGLWTINNHPANFDRVETVLSAIANAKATDFVDESLIKGLKPAIRYDLKAGDQSYSFVIYEKNLPAKKELPAEKRYYAQSSSMKELVQVEPLVRSNLDKKLTDLRETIMFTNTEKVTATRFAVEGPGYKVNPDFFLQNGKWIPKDSSQEWELSFPQRIVDLFAVTRIKDFVSPPPAGKELFKLAIGDEKNPTKFHVSLYTIKDRLYARNLNEKTNEVYLMEDSMKAALPKTEKEWKIVKDPAK